MIALKYVAKVVAGQSPSSSEVSNHVSGTPFLQGNAEFSVQFPNAKYECNTAPRRSETDDILLSVRAPVGALNIADQSYGIGRGLCAVRATGCNPRFLWWWFHSQRSALAAVSKGSTYDAVTAEEVSMLEFPELQLEEQRRIADFLDAETARIDNLSDLVQRSLALLEERRTLTVLHCIQPLMESPRRAIPLKYMASAVSVGIVITPAKWYVDGEGVIALRGLNIRPGGIDQSEIVKISHEGHRLNGKSKLRAGDVVVVRTGQAGVAAVVPDSLDGANCIEPFRASWC